MAEISVFERNEKKYLISDDQYNRLIDVIGTRLTPDTNGNYTVTTIYYDTDDFFLIRECVEHAEFREKLRVRIYSDPSGNERAFAEIKKKCNHVGYKRRVPIALQSLKSSLESQDSLAEHIVDSTSVDPQKAEELRFMINRYGLKPKIIIRCEREPYEVTEDADVRITFDKNLMGKHEDVDFSEDAGYKPIIEGKRVMEIKVPLAMPVWLSKAINDLEIYPQRFSKVGTYYTEYLCKEVGDKLNAK